MALELKVTSNVRKVQARYVKFLHRFPRIIQQGLDQAGEQLKTIIVKRTELGKDQDGKRFMIRNEDSSLDDYWKIFLADAIRSGRLDPGLNRTVNLFFGDEPDFASGVTADHAGRAHSICNNEVISFEIIESFWEDYTIVQRLFTFYHEAGHARYNYRHPCEFNETCATNTSENFPIMWRTIPLGNTTLEQFINHKNDFFGRRWEGVRYLNCM